MIWFWLTFGLLAIGAVLVGYGAIVKNNWGIDLRGLRFCTRCGGALPRVRVPKSYRQWAWGGCACPSCGAELDKWGREIGSRKC